MADVNRREATLDDVFLGLTSPSRPTPSDTAIDRNSSHEFPTEGVTG